MATLIYSPAFRSDSTGRALPPRPFGAREGFDGDCIPITLTTTFLNDAAGVAEILPIPLGRQLIRVSLTWGRGDTGGSPTYATSLLLRVTDKNGNNVDQLVSTPVLSAAQATPLVTLIPLLPSTPATNVATGSVTVGSGATNGSQLGYGRLVLQNSAAAATAAQVTLTLLAEWK